MAKRPNNNNIILLLLPSTDGAASFHYQMRLNMTGNNHEIPPGHYSISIIQNCTRMHPTMNNLRVVSSTSFTRIGGRRLKFCSPVSPLSSLSAHWTRMCVPRDFTIFPGSQVVIFDATPKSLQLCNSFFSSMTIFVVRTNRDPRGEDEVTSPKTRTRLCADLKLPHGTSTIDDFHSGFVVHARDAIESYLRVDRSSRRLIWVIVTCEETLVCFQFPMGGPSTMTTQRLGPVTMICRVRDKPKKFTD